MILPERISAYRMGLNSSSNFRFLFVQGSPVVSFDCLLFSLVSLSLACYDFSPFASVDCLISGSSDSILSEALKGGP